MEWLTVRANVNGRNWRAGDLVELPEALALAMIRDGRADPSPLSLVPKQPEADIGSTARHLSRV